MKITTLWVVTRPLSHFTEPGDCCWAFGQHRPMVADLALQFGGGMKASDVLAVYTEESEARAHAERVLAAHLAYLAAIRSADASPGADARE